MCSVLRRARQHDEIACGKNAVPLNVIHRDVASREPRHLLQFLA